MLQKDIKSLVLNSNLRCFILIYYRTYPGHGVVEVQLVVLMRTKIFRESVALEIQQNINFIQESLKNTVKIFEKCSKLFVVKI